MCSPSIDHEEARVADSDLVSFADGARVNSSVPDLEQRLTNLQMQMDRLRHVPASDPEPAEQRLAALTDECAEIVKAWAQTSERHARAVTRFEAHLAEWNDAGTRLQQDASQRIQELEKVIQHEWHELRQIHDEPVRQLHEHATSLTQVCIATADAAQQGFERSEARLAAIEGEVNRRLSELTRELQAVVVELRANQLSQIPQLAGVASAWPLDGVTRLHNQLRQADPLPSTSLDVMPVVTPEQRTIAGMLPEAAALLSNRVDSLERSLAERDTHLRAAAGTARVSRTWRAALAAAFATLIVLAVGVAWQLQSKIRVTADQAKRDAQIATDTATRQLETYRQQASRQLEEFQARAVKAQTMADILTAPDLAQYNLTGRDTLDGATAQVRWSRSRGFVFSGSLIPAPPPKTRYQLWLLTRGGAISAGTFAPDANGATTVSSQPLPIARPVIGAMVTLEPITGSATPTGDLVMARTPVVSNRPPLQ